MTTGSKKKTQQHENGGGDSSSSSSATVAATVAVPAPTTPTKATTASGIHNKDSNSSTSDSNNSKGGMTMTMKMTPEQIEREAKIKAEARAYALSGSTNEGRNYKRKLPQTQLQFAVELQHQAAQQRQQQQQQRQQQQQHTMSLSPLLTPPLPVVVVTAGNNKRQRTTPPPPAAATATATATAAAAATITSAPKGGGGSGSGDGSHVLPPPKKSTASVTQVHTKLHTTTKSDNNFNSNSNDNNNDNNNPKNSNDDYYDPEYLKMIQSLGDLDDFSIWDKLDNVEDEEFRLSDLDDDYDDDDGDDDDDDDDNDDDTLDEDGDDDNDNDDDNYTFNGLVILDDSAPPGTLLAPPPASPAPNKRQKLIGDSSSSTPIAAVNTGTPTLLSSPPLHLPGWDDSKAYGGEFYKNLEEELGSLLEEDLEAAVQSLYFNSKNAEDQDDNDGITGAGGNGNSGSNNNKKKRGRKSTKASSLANAAAAEQQQPLLYASTVGNAGTSAHTPVTAATLAAEAKTKQLMMEAAEKAATATATATTTAARNKKSTSSAMSSAAGTGDNRKSKDNKDKDIQPLPDTPMRDAVKQSNDGNVIITYRQSQQLRTLMNRHYQLLTQQAILSVRAAQHQKTGGRSSSSSSSSSYLTGGNGGGTTSTGTTTNSGNTIPDSPLSGSTANNGDFLCGENENDLTEILDLAVGMLQDLDEKRKDAIRTQMQLSVSSHSHTNTNTNTNTSTITAMDTQPSKALLTTTSSTTTTSMGNNISNNNGDINTTMSVVMGTNNNNDDIDRKLVTGARRSLQFDEGCDDDDDDGGGAMVRRVEKEQEEKALLPSSAAAAVCTSSSVNNANIIVQSGRLTRAAFRKKLQTQNIAGSAFKRTAFDIPGLLKLNETFTKIDDSVNVNSYYDYNNHGDGGSGSVRGGSVSSSNAAVATAAVATVVTSTTNIGKPLQPVKVNILEVQSHSEACRLVLKDAGANIEEQLLPGTTDLSESYSQLEEHFPNIVGNFKPPCTQEQELFLRKNRNLFTSGEDNLVLRGVNLYGEKQWILIADRYLPDRSINIISQRYSKLCVMLYKANGIYIDSKGNLLEPPKHESVDDIDEDLVRKQKLTLVDPPAILNVHRWSMEEDLSLLKAVPIMGHMWAELGARLIPHRDRGHLRKRYQVLERRVKATITRGYKQAAKVAKQNALKKQPQVPTLYSTSRTTSMTGNPTKSSRSKVLARAVGRPPKYGVGNKKVAGIATAAAASLSAATTAKLHSSPIRRGLQTHKTLASSPVANKSSPSRVVRASSSPNKSGRGKKISAAAATTVLQNANNKAIVVPKKSTTTATIREKKKKDGDLHHPPLMSLESAAASLAFMNKPKENEKEKQHHQSNSSLLQSTAAVLKNIRLKTSSSPSSSEGEGVEAAKEKATSSKPIGASTSKAKRAVLHHVSSIPKSTVERSATATAPQHQQPKKIQSSSIRKAVVATTTKLPAYPVGVASPQPSIGNSIPIPPQTKMKTYAFPLRAGTRITTTNGTDKDASSQDIPINPPYVYQYPHHPHPDYPHGYYHPRYYYPYPHEYHQQQQENDDTNDNNKNKKDVYPPSDATSSNNNTNENANHHPYPYHPYYHHHGFPPQHSYPHQHQHHHSSEMKASTDNDTTPSSKTTASQQQHGFSAASKRYYVAAAAAAAASSLSSPKPNSSAPQMVRTPIGKSLMASIPKMVGEHLASNYNNNGDGDASRLAYEKLIEGGPACEDGNNNVNDAECSEQMSRVKRMMANEDESEAADAIVSHLAKSPGRRRKTDIEEKDELSKLSTTSFYDQHILGPDPISKFPTHYDPHSNITGFSVLNEASIETAAAGVVVNDDETSSKKNCGESSGLNLLERVLHSSSSNDLKLARSSSTTNTKTIAGEAKHSTNNKTTTSITVANPETPIKNKQRLSSGGFFSTAGGTPLLGLSPGFRSLASSSLLKNDGGIVSTNLTAPFSPAPSSLLKGEGVGALTNLGTTTNLSVPYSPAPSTVLRIFDDKTDENGLFFNNDSRICEDSNQLGDLAVGANLNLNNSNNDQHHQYHPVHNHDNNNNSNVGTATSTSLLIAPDEFDAISGLGALSNSPFKASMSNNNNNNNTSSSTCPIPLIDRDGGGDDGSHYYKNNDNKQRNKPATKSFFARVIGDSKEASPQKKLHF